MAMIDSTMASTARVEGSTMLYYKWPKRPARVSLCRADEASDLSDSGAGSASPLGLHDSAGCVVALDREWCTVLTVRHVRSDVMRGADHP